MSAKLGDYKNLPRKLAFSRDELGQVRICQPTNKSLAVKQKLSVGIGAILGLVEHKEDRVIDLPVCTRYKRVGRELVQIESDHPTHPSLRTGLVVDDHTDALVVLCIGRRVVASSQSRKRLSDCIDRD